MALKTCQLGPFAQERGRARRCASGWAGDSWGRCSAPSRARRAHRATDGCGVGAPPDSRVPPCPLQRSLEGQGRSFRVCWSQCYLQGCGSSRPPASGPCPSPAPFSGVFFLHPAGIVFAVLCHTIASCVALSAPWLSTGELRTAVRLP